jgi:hypothetical protein
MNRLPDDTTKPSRLNRRRKKKWRAQSLTLITPAVMIRSHSQKTSVGFGRPYIQGARAMRRKSCGFFYAQNPSMAGGVVGGRMACRALGPVDQPATSSAAQSLVAPRGGLTTSKEPIMSNQSQGAPEIQGKTLPPKQARFDLLKYGGGVKTLICRDLSSAQAASLLPELSGVYRLHFTGMMEG